jgi:superfamily I DNA and RNA helicase
MRFAYHVTPRRFLKTILRDGLLPKAPEDYGTSGDTKAVYLFKNLDDVENALMNWLGERINEIEDETGVEEDVIVLKIDIAGLKGFLASVEYELVYPDVIGPERVLEILKV